MLTKEEILENWNMFVGSQATNYGEDLTRNHDELWDPCAASDVRVCERGGLLNTFVFYDRITDSSISAHHYHHSILSSE